MRDDRKNNRDNPGGFQGMAELGWGVREGVNVF